MLFLLCARYRRGQSGVIVNPSYCYGLDLVDYDNSVMIIAYCTLACRCSVEYEIIAITEREAQFSLNKSQVDRTQINKRVVLIAVCSAKLPSEVRVYTSLFQSQFYPTTLFANGCMTRKVNISRHLTLSIWTSLVQSPNEKC